MMLPLYDHYLEGAVCEASIKQVACELQEGPGHRERSGQLLQLLLQLLQPRNTLTESKFWSRGVSVHAKGHGVLLHGRQQTRGCHLIQHPARNGQGQGSCDLQAQTCNQRNLLLARPANLPWTLLLHHDQHPLEESHWQEARPQTRCEAWEASTAFLQCLTFSRNVQ